MRKGAARESDSAKSAQFVFDSPVSTRPVNSHVKFHEFFAMKYFIKYL